MPPLSRSRQRAFVAAGLGLAGLGLLAVCAGCPGAGGSAKLAGAVTANGKPVTSGTVTAIGSDDKVYQTPIRPDGTYEFTNLPSGPVRVAVVSTNPRPAGGPSAGGASPQRKGRPGVKAGAGSPRPGGGGAGAGASGRPAGGGKQGPSPLGMDPPAGAAPAAPPPVQDPVQAQAQANWFPIPVRYADPKTSGLGTQAGTGGRFDIKAD